MANKVANIVASVKLESQSSTIATTTLFTPSTPGLFRLSAFVEAISGTTGNGFGLDFTYQDDAGNSGAGVVGSMSTSVGGSPSTKNVVFRSVAQAIQYSVPAIDAGLTGYNIYIVLESLD